MRLVLILCFAIAVAIVVIAGSSLGRAIPFTREGHCLRGNFTAERPDAQIIAIGSSRIRRGIEADILTEAYDWPDGAVVNLGHPGISLPMDYSIISDATETATPQVVVFGIVPVGLGLRAAEREISPPRGGTGRAVVLSSGRVKQRYVMASSYPDLIRRAYTGADNILVGTWDAVQLLSRRMQNFIPALIEGNVTRGLVPARSGYYVPRDYDCMRTRWENPSEDAQHGGPAKRKKRADYLAFFTPGAEGAWEDPSPLSFFTDPKRRIDHRVIHDMVALGEERGFVPVFYYMPRVAVPIDPQLATMFEDKFGASLLIPPEPLRRRMEQGFYVDTSHLNTKGRVVVGQWLAEALRPYLDLEQLSQ